MTDVASRPAPEAEVEAVPNASADDLVSLKGVALLALLYAAMAITLAYLMAAIWPNILLTDVQNANGQLVKIPRMTPEGRPVWDDTIQLLWITFKELSDELRMFLVVITAGLIGAFVHSATSFADYAGNRRLSKNWICWLLLRLPIGAALALIVYFLIRGGLLTGGTTSTALQPFGIAGVAALTGLFSKQATDKLRELFDTLLRTHDGDAARADKLQNPTPVLEKVDPNRVSVGAGEAEIRLHGSQFSRASRVKVGSNLRDCSYVDEQTLILNLTSADLRAPTTINVAVLTPSPGGGVTDVRQINVE